MCIRKQSGLTSELPRSVSYRSRRLSLCYSDWGNENAPALILIHGGRDHGRSWDGVANALSGRFHVVATDLAGHGDSEWSNSGDYPAYDFVYDLSRLIEHLSCKRVSIVAHSFGGNIALRYAGLYPDTVGRLAVIEGLGRFRHIRAEQPIAERFEAWIAELRAIETRTQRHYATPDEARARMMEENPHLSAEQADHLTRHGVRANDDGTVSWKFDPYFRVWPPTDDIRAEIEPLWRRIACPVLLINGSESGRADPRSSGQLALFRDARALTIEGAGHWVHHDRLDALLAALQEFLGNGASG
jgi:pimeloyl-ACP methyl ester carboxylesterase